MDPGEQTTGTRDEHYNLISVLYHALQGAEACDVYALDAEAAGRAELAGYFQEARTTYTRVADQAKGMLGILESRPGPEIPPDEAPTSGNTPSGAPQVAARISPDDFDATISALRGGVENLGIERALEEIDGWEITLDKSGDPELALIAENLRQLRSLLTAGVTDRATVGRLLNTLGEQVQGVAAGNLEAGIAEKLQQLGGLLNTEARSISS